MARKLFLILITILIIAVLLVPTQSDYFQRIQSDYEEIHQTSSLDKAILKEFGDYKYQNRLIFSQFDYSFRNISVSYYGFFNIIIFKSSKKREPKSPQITV
ncbi:MAG: hypothetical protein ACQETL_14825 [Bacteroidota bacterium]